MPRSQITKKLRSAHIAEQVGDVLELSNRFSSLDSMQDAEVQQAWIDFQQEVVKAAEDVKKEDFLEPRRPWISEDTMDLIRKRALVKKCLMETEDKDKHKDHSTELWKLQKQIKTSARSDRKNWIHGIIQDIEKAGNSGDSKKVFEGVKKLSGSKDSPPASLDGIDSDIWVKFFTNLLGRESKPEEISAEEIKEKRAWRICQDNLGPGKRVSQWNVDLTKPEEEEIVEALKKARVFRGLFQRNSGRTVSWGARY